MCLRLAVDTRGSQNTTSSLNPVPMQDATLSPVELSEWVRDLVLTYLIRCLSVRWWSSGSWSGFRVPTLCIRRTLFGPCGTGSNSLYTGVMHFLDFRKVWKRYTSHLLKVSSPEKSTKASHMYGVGGKAHPFPNLFHCTCEIYPIIVHKLVCLTPLSPRSL